MPLGRSKKKKKNQENWNWMGPKLLVNANDVGFEVLTALVMKTSIFWDITSCGPLKVHRRFAVTCRLHIQCQIDQSRNQSEAGSQHGCLAYSLTLKMEATYSSETSARLSTAYTALYRGRYNPSKLIKLCYWAKTLSRVEWLYSGFGLVIGFIGHFYSSWLHFTNHYHTD
jgi:hypothetical protein